MAYSNPMTFTVQEITRNKLKIKIINGGRFSILLCIYSCESILNSFFCIVLTGFYRLLLIDVEFDKLRTFIKFKKNVFSKIKCIQLLKTNSICFFPTFKI